MIWRLGHKADAIGVKIADRHYSRRKIGSPQFMPPGQTIVLVSTCAYVDTRKVRRKRDPGRCFRRAGYIHTGWSADRKKMLQKPFEQRGRLAA